MGQGDGLFAVCFTSPLVPRTLFRICLKPTFQLPVCNWSRLRRSHCPEALHTIKLLGLPGSHSRVSICPYPLSLSLSITAHISIYAARHSIATSSVDLPEVLAPPSRSRSLSSADGTRWWSLGKLPTPVENKSHPTSGMKEKGRSGPLSRRHLDCAHFRRRVTATIRGRLFR